MAASWEAEGRRGAIFFSSPPLTHDQLLDAHERNCRTSPEEFPNEQLSEIFVNAVPFLVPRNADNPVERGKCDNRAPQILRKGYGEDGVRATTFGPRVAFEET